MNLRLSRIFVIVVAVCGVLHLVSCDPHGRSQGRDIVDPEMAGNGGDGDGDSANGDGENGDTAAPVAPENPGGPPVAILSGRAVFTGGEAPKNPPVRMGDPTCAGLHEKPPLFENYVIGENMGVANVIVHVSGGLPSGQTFEPPAGETVFDQEGCVYTPHVFSVMAGEQFKVLNSDPLLHNVNMQPKKNRPVNKGMPTQGSSFQHTFRRAESEPVRIKCDVHPWMQAFAGVFDHPFHAVTKEDGSWSFKTKLPAGTYNLTAWHERMGEKTVQVTIADGEAAKEAPTFEFTK